MGWFKDNQSTTPDNPVEEAYSLEKVRGLLDQIGQGRLDVSNPKLKVLLTLISQNGEPHLVRNSPDGKPSESDIMQFQEHLQAVVRVLEQYEIIQNDFGYPGRDERLAEIFGAIDGLATKVLNKATPSGTQAKTNLAVDNRMLSALRYS